MEFARVTPIHRKSCSIGFHCATELRKNHRPLSAFQDFNGGAIRWWTGEDSNLRSPQGAADLQSAGFSHSPTRPRKNPPNSNRLFQKNLLEKSSALSENTKRTRVKRHQPVNFEFQDSLRLTPLQNFWWSWRRELNPRPSDYKSDALPAELRQRSRTEQE